MGSGWLCRIILQSIAPQVENAVRSKGKNTVGGFGRRFCFYEHLKVPAGSGMLPRVPDPTRQPNNAPVLCVSPEYMHAPTAMLDNATDTVFALIGTAMGMLTFTMSNTEILHHWLNFGMHAAVGALVGLSVKWLTIKGIRQVNSWYKQRK